MTLLWSPESIHDLLALRAHINEHDPAAAKRVALHILYCVEYLLSENPKLGGRGMWRIACPHCGWPHDLGPVAARRPINLKIRSRIRCRVGGQQGSRCGQGIHQISRCAGRASA